MLFIFACYFFITTKIYIEIRLWENIGTYDFLFWPRHAT